MCQRDSELADQAVLSSHVEQLQGQLVDLNQRLGGSSGSLSRFISQAISQKISARTAHLRDEVGFLEQEQALGAIHSNLVWTAGWLLRIVIIAIALLPLALSMAMAGTTYEKLVRAAATSAIAATAARRKDTAENLQAIAALATQIIEHLDRLPQPAAEQAQTDFNAIHDELTEIRARLGKLADNGKPSRGARKKP